MNRILVFHLHETSGNEAFMLPSHYIDADYSKVAVRIRAESAPIRDAKINIYDDGVSIFSNRTSKAYNVTTGVDITGADLYEAVLSAGQNGEEMAEDFNTNVIEEGSWITCKLVDAGGGKNFTVQLELHPLSEDEELED